MSDSDEKAVRELISALRIFIRSANLEAMSDAGFRLAVVGMSRELFDKHANEDERELLQDELRYDAEARDIIHGKPH